MNKHDFYKTLKSGTDIRGVAVETQGCPVQLTDEAVFDLTSGFCCWLKKNGAKPGSAVAVGHDCRISSQRIKAMVTSAVCAAGMQVYDCGMASTPAMFMATINFDCCAAVQITASHHPFDRNGLKFFTKNGGLDSGDIDVLIDFAAENTLSIPQNISAQKVPCMQVYAKGLRKMITDALDVKENDKPLAGYKIIVDAGNGVGGFYANDVLLPLGADITGSQFLDPDGTFPNHAPNPENSQAMAAVSQATAKSGADLGIIFDTDVDRAGCVDSSGSEINRSRLVALASIIALEGNEGGTIVTDSVTSAGLTSFINNTLGAVHYRYKRGYRNVINKQLEFNKAGINCPLAIETSGHAAFRENYYLDDGAYLVTRIIIKMAQLGKQGKTLDSLIAGLKQPLEECEKRFKIIPADFKQYGYSVIDDLAVYAEKKTGWKIADDNREGIRVFLDKEHGDGWFLLRLSVHDPIMPLNIESDSPGGANKILQQVMDFLIHYDLEM